MYIDVDVDVYIYTCEKRRTGWRRLIGSLKLQIIFHKRATQYRSLLRKMTTKVRDPMSLRHPVQLSPEYVSYIESHIEDLVIRLFSHVYIHIHLHLHLYTSIHLYI